MNKNYYRPLAKGYNAPNDDIDSGYNNNDLIVGGSGTGKTGGYVIPNLLNPYGNMIVSDTKGRLYKETKKVLENAGYHVMKIDFIHPRESVGYNPLLSIRETEDGYSQIDIMTVVSKILPLEEGKNRDDRFWIESARGLVGFLIAFTLEAFERKDHNMVTVAEVLKGMETQSGKDMINKWMLMNPDSYVADLYRMSQIITQSERTWSCIQKFAVGGLETFLYKDLRKIFKSDENAFNVKKFLRRKTVLFINNSDVNRYADRIVSLLYAQLINDIFEEADKREDGRLKIPVRFIIDDFASNVYIEDFDKLISVTRSRNISLSIIVQNLTQLSAMYGGNKANTIIVNCDHILYLGGQAIKTAEYIGHRAGVTEDKVLVMPADKAYLIKRGEKAVLVDKIEPYKEIKEKMEELRKKEVEKMNEEIELDFT